MEISDTQLSKAGPTISAMSKWFREWKVQVGVPAVLGGLIGVVGWAWLRISASLVLLALGIVLLGLVAAQRIRSGNWWFGPALAVEIRGARWDVLEAGYLHLQLAIRNRRRHVSRSVRQHWLKVPGRPQINGDMLLLNQDRASRTVGRLNPGETVEGLASFTILNPPLEMPDFALYVEDETGRASRAFEADEMSTFALTMAG